MEVSGIVLAGGKGSRLGRKKALETLNNTSLLQRVVSQLAFLNGDIFIVVAKTESFPGLVGSHLHVITDILPGKGPLGGIFAGLKASHTAYNVVVACDMPFLNQELLKFMVDVAEGFDIVVPRVGNRVEPLHAVYSQKCIAPIEDLLKRDILSVNILFNQMNVRYVDIEEIDRFDPAHLSFFNINTQDDLTRAKQLDKENN